MQTLESVALFLKEGTSDKEYNVELVETNNNQYVVNFSFGRRGNAVNSGTKTKTPVDLATAKKVYSKLVDEKQAKGYKPNGTAQSFTVVGEKESTGLFPQLLIPIEENDMERYITDDQYWGQEKLDGKRIIAQTENKIVTTSNRKALVCGVPKEIEQGLASLDTGTVLDGEMIGTTYCVFDILKMGNIDVRESRCDNRFSMLEAFIKSRKPQNITLVKCAKTTEEKRALVESLKHKEGVVFKLRSAPYTPGKSTTQIKCKFWSDVSVQVIKINDKASIQVGIMSNGSIVPVGNVTINGHPTPNVGDIVDVTYLYAFPGGSLYQPKYRGVRDDHDVDDISVLKYKSEDTDD